MNNLIFEEKFLKRSNRNYLVIDECDVEEYLSSYEKTELFEKINEILSKIENGRKKDNKKSNSYIVINSEEQVDEIVEVMNQHGYFNQ